MRDKYIETKRFFVGIILFLMIGANFAMASDTTAAPEVASFRTVKGNPDPTYSGEVAVSVPLFTVPGPGLEFPISLSYKAGITTHQEASSVGLGWSLSAGSIVRGSNVYLDDKDYQGEMGKSITTKACVLSDGSLAGSGCGATTCSGGGALTSCLGGCFADQEYGGCSDVVTGEGNTHPSNQIRGCIDDSTGMTLDCLSLDEDIDPGCDDGSLVYCDGSCQEGEINGCTKGAIKDIYVEGSMYSSSKFKSLSKSGGDEEGGNQDNYFLNFPGGASKMMFDDDGEFHPLSWSAIDVDYSSSGTKDAKSQIFETFEVKSVDGTEYVFGGVDDSLTGELSTEANHWTAIIVEDTEYAFSSEEIADKDPGDVCVSSGNCADQYTSRLSYNTLREQGQSHENACQNAWICPYEYDENPCGDSYTHTLSKDRLYDPINSDFPQSIRSGSSTSPAYSMRLWKCKDCSEPIHLVATDSEGCRNMGISEYDSLADYAPYNKYNKIAEHINTWYMTEIRSTDFVDVDGNGADEGDEGSWVKINYVEKSDPYVDETPIYSAQEIGDTLLEPQNEKWFYYDTSRSTMTGEQVAYIVNPRINAYANDGFDKVLGASRAQRSATKEIINIESIVTPTHRADFIYGNEEIPQLNEVILYYAVTGTDQELFRYVFEYADGSTNVKLKDPANQGHGQRTLLSVQKRAYNYNAANPDTYEPAIIFDYVDCNPSFDINKYDNKGLNREFTDVWGYYTDEKDENGVYKVDSMTDVSGACGANAWSLKRITYPTGGYVDYTYEPNAYDYAPKSNYNPTNPSECNLEATSNNCWDQSLNKIGAGVRVSEVTVYDGLTTPVTSDFEYGDGVATRAPSEVYDQAGQSWDYALPWDHPGAGSGVYVAYSTITSITPADGSFGKVVYNYKDPFEEKDDDWNNCAGHDINGECTSGYLTDNSWKRNYVEDVTYYDSSNNVVKTVVNKYSSSPDDVKYQWEMTNDYVDPISGLKPSTDNNQYSVPVDYELKSTFPKLERTTTVLDGVTNIVEYDYNDVNGLVSETREIGPHGTKVSQVEYAYESYAMQSDNMLSQQKKTVLREGSATGPILAEQETVWSNSWTGDANGKWYPKETYSGVGSEKIKTSEFVEYDKYGNLLESKNARGYSTEMYYGNNEDPCSNSASGLGNTYLTCVKDALNNEVKTYYDDRGRVDIIEDENNRPTYFDYDSLSRLDKVQRPTDGGEPRTEYNYKFAMSTGSIGDSNLNEVDTTKDLDGSKEFTAIGVSDGLGRNIQNQLVKDDDNVIVQDVEFNEISKVKSKTKPIISTTNKAEYVKNLGFFDKFLYRVGITSNEEIEENRYLKDSSSEVKTEVEYNNDPLSRVAEVYPLGKNNPGLVVSTQYTNDGSDLRKAIITDEEDKQTESYYDEFGNLRKVVDAEDNEIIYDYSLKGELLSVNAEGVETVNTYDSLGRLNSSCNPDSGCVSYTYDNNGNILTKTDARGWITDFDYDSLDRVESIKVNKGSGLKEVLSYTYDSGCIYSQNEKGKLCKVEGYDDYGNLISAIVYNYDDSGRITDMQADGEVFGQPTGDTLQVTYDYADNIDLMFYDGYNSWVDYTYNSLNQLERADIYAGTESGYVEYEYNPSGTINTSTYGNGVVTEYEYNDRDWVESITVGSLFYEDYQYDDSGNLKSMSDGTGSATFDYDNLYRLANVTDAGYYDEGSFTLDHINYIYDEVGNRLSRNMDGDATGYVYDDPCSPGEYCYGKEDNRLMSTTNPPCSYDYDEVGNMIMKVCGNKETYYHYDQNNMLMRIDMPEGKYLKFVYDVEGRRIAKLDNDGVLTSYTYGFGINPLTVTTDVIANPEIGMRDSLVKNPSFEADFGMSYNTLRGDSLAGNSIPDGWVIGNYPGNAMMDFTESNDGEASVRLTSENRPGAITQYVPVTIGRKYMVSARMKVDSVCMNNPDCEANLAFFCFKESNSASTYNCPIDSDDWPSVNSQEWTTVEREFTITEPGTTHLEVVCYNSAFKGAGTDGTTWCDSVNVQDITPPNPRPGVRPMEAVPEGPQ